MSAEDESYEAENEVGPQWSMYRETCKALMKRTSHVADIQGDLGKTLLRLDQYSDEAINLRAETWGLITDIKTQIFELKMWFKLEKHKQKVDELILSQQTGTRATAKTSQ